MISLNKIDSFKGSISPEETSMLASYASKTNGKAIVEIGSWQGKSALALAVGASEQNCEQPAMVYCVDPHSSFKGIYGGRFGPADRTCFYQTMLEADCSEQVALINLPSEQAATGWREPIGLLFIDGDHTKEAVQRDIDAWLPHVVPNGIVVFDDAVDTNIGPHHVIKGLVEDGLLETITEVGKTVILRKKTEKPPVNFEELKKRSAVQFDQGSTEAYLSLLEKTILNEINPENGARIKYLVDLVTNKECKPLDRLDLLRSLVSMHQKDPAIKKSLNDRYKPRNWWTKTLSFPFSMIGPGRLQNVKQLSREVIKNGVEGAFVETGVWRGGACLMMKGTMKALDVHRPLFVCDSFEGLPALDEGPDKELRLDENPLLTAPLEDVQSHFERFGLLDDDVHFVKGWFSETMEGVRNEVSSTGIALLRLDGDYYSSTMDVLVELYPLVQKGGYVIIDDYHAYEQCRQATDEYRAAKSIDAAIQEIDNVGVFWQV